MTNLQASRYQIRSELADGGTRQTSLLNVLSKLGIRPDALGPAETWEVQAILDALAQRFRVRCVAEFDGSDILASVDHRPDREG